MSKRSVAPPPAKSKPIDEQTARPAAAHRSPPRPPSPRATTLYHDFLEMTVRGFFGGKAIEYLNQFARQKAGKLSQGMKMRTRTLRTMWQSVEACRLALYPYNKKRPRPAA